MLIRFAAAVAVAALLVPAPARAQERPAEIEGYDIPGWSFTPSFTFGMIHDSNVALTGRAAEGGGTVGDTFFNLVPGGRLSLLSPRTQFDASYTGYLRRYVDIDQLNGFDQRAFVSLRHAVTPRLTIFAQNEFNEDPTTDSLDLDGLPFLRIGSRSNRLNGGIEARLTKFTDLRVRYDNTWTRWDQLNDLVSDGTIHGFFVDVRRRFSERFAAGVEGRLRRSDLTALEPREIWFNDVGGLVEYRVGPHTTLTGAAGFSRLKDSRFEEARNAPYFRAQLGQRLARAMFGVSFERSNAPSFGFGGSNDNRELRGFFHMPFSRNRFYVRADGGWRRSDPAFGDVDLRLDTFLTNATFGYSATRWFRAEAYHAWSLQDSIVTGGEVARHRVGAQFVISQPMRIQ